MSWCPDQSSRTRYESGQVLAEAVVVMLLLVVMLTAVHISGSRQFQWARQWLAAQIAADAVALDHAHLPKGARAWQGSRNRWHRSVMQEFQIGSSHWQAVSTEGKFAQVAWRLSGAGQASSDEMVTRRIEQATRIWRNPELASKVVVDALMPTIKAVEMPWDDRGSATQWLQQWQGSTPPAYLSRVP